MIQISNTISILLKLSKKEERQNKRVSLTQKRLQFATMSIVNQLSNIFRKILVKSNGPLFHKRNETTQILFILPTQGSLIMNVFYVGVLGTGFRVVPFTHNRLASLKACAVGVFWEPMPPNFVNSLLQIINLLINGQTRLYLRPACILSFIQGQESNTSPSL